MAENVKTNDVTEMINKKLLSWLGDGMACVAVYQGSELGLFDQLGKYDSPKNSQQIADDLDYKERYVREWLDCMVVAGLIDIHNDSSCQQYYLPPERRPALCRPTATFPLWCGFIIVVAPGHQHLLDCFKKDGPIGIPHDVYGNFHQWKTQVVEADYPWEAIKKFLSQVPGLLEKLDTGICVLEPGCGPGISLMILAEKFPKSTVIGLDLDPEQIELAKQKAADRKLTNISFKSGDACYMPDDWKEKFDYVFCFETIHDIWKPSLVISEIYKVLKHGGCFSMSEVNMQSNVKDNIGIPIATYTYTSSLHYCMPTSLNHPGSEGVGASWGVQKMEQVLQQAGFVEIKPVSETDAMDVHFVAKKD